MKSETDVGDFSDAGDCLCPGGLESAASELDFEKGEGREDPQSSLNVSSDESDSDPGGVLLR